MRAARCPEAVNGSSHAALMDSVYRRQRHIYDFTRKYYLFGRDRLIDTMQPKPDARILEIGCGTARNLVRLAKRYPGRRLFGLDASEAMLETAERAIARAGLSGQIRLAHAYAENLSPSLFGEEDAFDNIVFSYSLSMIPDWRQALGTASGALSQSGRIHIVDFGDLEGLPRPLRRPLLAWLKLFHVEPRIELLGDLERSAKKNDVLQILTGRYAFVLASRADGFSNTMAVLPQGHRARIKPA
jgi:S-adenosylmethionine-diacylgycerolhomoserine-N-methlytransferase